MAFPMLRRLLRFARNDNTCNIYRHCDEAPDVVIARSAQRDEAISATRTGLAI